MLTPNLVPAAMVAAAIAPAVLLLWFVVAADSRSEPPWMVLSAVVLGVLCFFVAYVLETWLRKQFPISGNVWFAIGQNALLFAAIPEETVKILVIAAIALRARDFDEPMDGIVYGAAVGLGFAGLENFVYLRSDTEWASTALVRGMSSVPFHGALGVIAGAYIARARFSSVLGGASHSRWRRPRLFLLAWLIPVVLHTVYDASIFSMRNVNSDIPDAIKEMLNMLVIVGFGTIMVAVWLTRRLAARQKAWQQTKRLPLVHWRGIWAECLISAGLSFVALSLVIAGKSIANIAGWTFMAITLGLTWKCGKYLSEAARNLHRPAGVLSP